MRRVLSIMLVAGITLALNLSSLSAQDQKKDQKKPGQKLDRQTVTGEIMVCGTKTNTISVKPQSGGTQIQTQSIQDQKGDGVVTIRITPKTKITGVGVQKPTDGKQGQTQSDQKPISCFCVGQIVRVVYVAVQTRPGKPGKNKPGQTQGKPGKDKPTQTQGKDKPDQTQDKPGKDKPTQTQGKDKPDQTQTKKRTPKGLQPVQSQKQKQRSGKGQVHGRAISVQILKPATQTQKD